MTIKKKNIISTDEAISICVKAGVKKIGHINYLLDTSIHSIKRDRYLLEINIQKVLEESKEHEIKERQKKNRSFLDKVILDKDGDVNQFVCWSLFYCLFFFMLLYQYFQFDF